MVPSIAQLVERRTVELIVVILRSLVRIRLEGKFYSSSNSFFRFSFLFFFLASVNICFLFSFEIFISYFYLLQSLLSLLRPEINVLSLQRHHKYMN